jgi:TolB-like protein/tetratricopeptide (TPR) repeat protein
MANTVRTLRPLNTVSPNDVSKRATNSSTTPGNRPIVRSFSRQPAPSAAVTELSYDEFVLVLKTALRNFNRPDLLARSPLLHSRLITAGASASGSDLQGLLTGTVNALFAAPGDEKLHRVIEISYFRPAPKQEAAAERLGLSFGTYRRHLANALDRLAKWLWERERALPNRPSRLSIAVMPFVNLGGDPRQDYLVDTLTEYLTTDLSRIPDTVVIGCNTAFTYKGKTIDARQVGRELGVRYIMEGSVQVAGTLVRVNARLIDTNTGAQLWAERFDRARTDLLDMQDEITAHLARTVDIELVAAESRCTSSKRQADSDSVDLTLRGLALCNRPLWRQGLMEARRFFEAALRLDDENVAALLGFADTHMLEVNFFRGQDRAEQIRVADAATAKALMLAPGNSRAHFGRGTVLAAMRAPLRARCEFERAVDLNRNFANAHAYIGLMEVSLGRGDATEAHVARAISLSPRDPLLDVWTFVAGLADLYLGRLERAVERLRNAADLNPRCALTHFGLASALALNGRCSEAAEARAVGLRLDANFTLRKICSEPMSDNPVYLTQRQRFLKGLRDAGVPEG